MKKNYIAPQVEDMQLETLMRGGTIIEIQQASAPQKQTAL